MPFSPAISLIFGDLPFLIQPSPLAYSSLSAKPYFGFFLSQQMASPNGVWTVTYTTAKYQDHGRIKAYDGMIHLWLTKEWLVLMNAKGAPIVSRSMQNGEILDMGSIVRFPSHTAMINLCVTTSKVCAPTLDLDVDIDASGMAVMHPLL
jgi:hypothetical protein